MEYIHHYCSPLGRMTMAADGAALTGLWFDGQKYFGSGFSGIPEEKEQPVFAETVRWLEQYFTGTDPGFLPPLRFRATAFRKTVWEILLRVPFGRTITYGEIADMIAEEQGLAAMSAQAVGGAVAHNPVSLIVPCHRVVGSRGELTGYAGGLERKRALLSLENALLPEGTVPEYGSGADGGFTVAQTEKVR